MPEGRDDVDAAIGELRTCLEGTLGGTLVGLYLYGSTASGNFTPGVSDLDLLAVVSEEISGGVFDRLVDMHRGFTTRNPQWEDRVEVQYVAAAALKEFRSRRSRIAVVSPGEPFCYKGAGFEWALNWYDVQENGITLSGPPPSVFIPRISAEEFVDSVVRYAGWKVDRIASHCGAEAYAVLTMCRALWTIETGTTTSKEAAAAWAEEHFPLWEAVINDAVECRRSPEWSKRQGDAVSRRRTLRFVRFGSAEIARRTGDLPGYVRAGAGEKSGVPEGASLHNQRSARGFR